MFFFWFRAAATIIPWLLWAYAAPAWVGILALALIAGIVIRMGKKNWPVWLIGADEE